MEGSLLGPASRDTQSGALIRLRGVYPSLKTALQKVANLILKQPEMAIYASVNEVAVAAQVSEATVMRFCRILGFKGFQDFKISLARELVMPSPARSAEAGEGRDSISLVRKIFQDNASALHETLEVLDLGQLQQVAHCLAGCRRLAVIGVSGAAPAAQYTAIRLAPLGLNIHYFSEVYEMMTAAALLTEADALLVISHSGGSPETLGVARAAKENGARVIAITSNSLAPLTRLADLVLTTSSRKMAELRDSLASFLCQVTVIDCLFVLLQQVRPEESRANLAKIQKTLQRSN